MPASSNAAKYALQYIKKLLLNLFPLFSKIYIKYRTLFFKATLCQFYLCLSSPPPSIYKVKVDLNFIVEFQYGIKSYNWSFFRIRCDFLFNYFYLFIKHWYEISKSFSGFGRIIMSDDLDYCLALFKPFIYLILFVFEIVSVYIFTNSDSFNFIFIRTSFRSGIVIFSNKLVMELILKVFLFRLIF